MVFILRRKKHSGHPVGSVNLPFEENVYFGAAVGFAATLVVAYFLDQLGNAMFRKGVAMPFFIGRTRVHHRRVLFYGLPTIYLALAGLFLAGYITIVWGLFWTGLVSSLVIASSCLALDFAMDYLRGEGRWGFFHHELIYLTVPAFAFSVFLKVAV